MRQPAFIIISLLFLTQISSGFAASKKEKNPPPLNETMLRLASTMKEFFPYIFSAKKFTDTKNKKIIESKINALSSLFAEVGPHFEKGAVTYRISYKVMLNHLKSAKKVFREENNYFAATMFKDIPNICVSCHNQDKIEKGFTMDTQRLDFDSDYEYAEYNYMARNYNKALKYFDLSLKGEGSALSEKDVYPSLRKTLTIYTQIEKDPHHAISYFEKFLVRKDIPLMVRNDIRDWISGLQDWDKHDDLKIKKLNWANLKPLVEKYLVPMSKGGAFNLDGKQQITYLRLAGLLYDYLQDGPNVKDTPEVLYWLAVCDRMLNYDYFFSLADLYLKECITSFSKSEIAPKCYQEYKEYINYAFTGSGIQEIPQDIQLELKTLKKKLKGHLIKK